MSNSFDVGIIGSGMAGAFAALKLAKEHKHIKTVLFDLGRPPGKRRRQLEGFLGAFPNSDGKFYIQDSSHVADISGNRLTKKSSDWIFKFLENHVTCNVVEDNSPSISAEKRIVKAGFEYYKNDYIPFFPKDIHIISKTISNLLDEKITFSFDNEVHTIHKQRGNFILTTSEGEFTCKKLLIAAGRSGWRWATDIFNNFGLIENNNVANFGIFAEISSSHMKDFNKSNLTFHKPGLEVGPISWNGTIIPEDHVDLAIASFRSNENRWKSDKVSFKIIGSIPFEGKGIEQTTRLGKLAFVLANDRILRERISTIITKKSSVSIIPEYNWLIDAVKDVTNVIPELISRGHFHIPTISPLPPKVNLGDNFSTELENLFIAGESAGIPGLYGAALTGVIAADGILK
jgi:thioredoxin reductase